MADTSFTFVYPFHHNGALIAEIEGRCAVDTWAGRDAIKIELFRLGSPSDLTVVCIDSLQSEIGEWLYKTHAEDINRCADAYEAGRRVYDREMAMEIRGVITLTAHDTVVSYSTWSA